MAFKTIIPVIGSTRAVEVTPENYAGLNRYAVSESFPRHPRYSRPGDTPPPDYIKRVLSEKLARHVTERNEVHTDYDVRRMEDIHTMDTYMFTKAEFRAAIIRCAQDVLSQVDFNAQQIVRETRTKIAEEGRQG